MGINYFNYGGIGFIDYSNAEQVHCIYLLRANAIYDTPKTLLKPNPPTLV